MIFRTRTHARGRAGRGVALLAAAAAAAAATVVALPVLAVDPMTGPHFDKEMVIDREAGRFGMTVGMFAACAQERVMSIVAGGVRPLPDQTVRGEEVDGEFVVTIPGVNENILFFFQPINGADGDEMFLARMAIGASVADLTADKERAISALVPFCI
ncbi:MAG: hypothetical protein O3C09_01805 [Proteobacteria bacterium]|nr:hypothetical protein [Pseudomonadota bacterium]